MNCEKLDKFMNIARAVSALSKDKNSKIGVIILGPDNEIRSVGYNGFTRGLNDEIDERHERPEKYFWSEHAERNAIYNAARVGIPLKGCTLIMAGHIFTCMDCARAIIQSGIIRVVVEDVPNLELEQWKEHVVRAVQLYKESNIEVYYFNLEKIKAEFNQGRIIWDMQT